MKLTVVVADVKVRALLSRHLYLYCTVLIFVAFITDRQPDLRPDISVVSHSTAIYRLGWDLLCLFRWMLLYLSL